MKEISVYPLELVLSCSKLPCFDKTKIRIIHKKVIKIKQESMFTCSDVKESQIWYDENCKLKKQVLHEAIRDFNLNKNDLNCRKVFDCRKDYIYYCRKCKLKFQRGRCKQMNEIRK